MVGKKNKQEKIDEAQQPQEKTPMSARLRKLREQQDGHVGKLMNAAGNAIDVDELDDAPLIPPDALEHFPDGVDPMEVAQAEAIARKRPAPPPPDKFTAAERPPPDEMAMANPFSQAQTKSSLQELAASVFQEKQLADKLMDTEDIEIKTRLNPDLTIQFAAGLLVAQEHNIPELAAFIYKLAEFRVSLMGEGRKELVEVARGGQGGMHPDVVSRMRG